MDINALLNLIFEFVLQLLELIFGFVGLPDDEDEE
jgi:hypothetical protein